MKPESREKILQEIAETKQQIAHLRERQNEAEIKLQLLNERLFQYDKAKTHQPTTFSVESIPATTDMSPEDKIFLVRSLFRGREDVYPKLWQNQKMAKKGYSPACSNEWVRGVCEKPRVKCVECPNQAFLPVSTDVILGHLQGRHIIGVYPMLRDETCWFLAVDFDKQSWQDDVLTFMETCRRIDIPYAIERSRSGNGAHVWFFFSSPVTAATARKMGSYLITKTMVRRHQLSMASYDRLFPNQDTLPNGGFGNLIALPLQYHPRQEENTVFLNDNLVPFQDQWGFPSALRRVAMAEVEEIAMDASIRYAGR